MANDKTSHSPLDVTVGGHHFHRSENGMVTHHVNGRPDHSSAGLMSTLEEFAQEIVRLRQFLPTEAEAAEKAPRIVDPLGSRPDE